MADNSTTGSHRVSMTGAHVATGATGRMTGRSTAATSRVTALTGVFKATASGRHEAIPAPKPEPQRMNPRKKRNIYIAFVAAAALLIVVLAMTARLTVKNVKYDQYLLSAQDSYSQGEYDNALSYIRRALALKETEECRFLMADCYTAAGHYDKALEILRSMNLSDSTVRGKISTVSEMKDEQILSEHIVLGSIQYDLGASVINLSGQKIGNSIFEECDRLYSVSNLNASENNITSLDGIETLAGLAVLDVSRNSITDISKLSELTNLRVLNLDQNPIEDLSPVYGLTGLTSLSICGIPITEEQLIQLSAALPNCAIHSESSGEEAPDITIGGRIFKSDVTELDLTELNLTDISALSRCKNLVTLNLSGNQISDITPLMDLAQLQTLNISDNLVTDLRALIAMSSLRTINAANNEITTTNALSAMNALEELVLDGNPITDFSGISKMYSLRSLSVKNTGLQVSDLEYIKEMGNLRYLYIEDNPDIDGETFDSFNLIMRDCRISHSPMVYSIQFCGESYKENITELNASGKEITAIDELVRFRYLDSIDLSSNNISNIYQFQYCCGNLVSLNLSNNQISDISAVTSLQNLKYLDLSYNKIGHINCLIGMTGLDVLNLRGNDIPEAEMSRLRSALPLCEIIY